MLSKVGRAARQHAEYTMLRRRRLFRVKVQMTRRDRADRARRVVVPQLHAIHAHLVLA